MSTRRHPWQLESAAAMETLVCEEDIRPQVSKVDRRERRVAKRKPVSRVMVEGRSETGEGRSPER